MLVPWEILCEDGEDSCNLLEAIVEVAAVDPLIFDEVIRGVLVSDPCIRIQAAEMVEKITRIRPLFLTPYKRILLNEFAGIEQVEVRAQLALLFGRVIWDEWDMQRAVNLLGTWIETECEECIIRNSMQSLYTLAMQKEWIRPRLTRILENSREHINIPVRNLAEKLFNPLWV